MSSSDSKRGKNPSHLTVHMLCAAAAGRCEFEGCNKPLFRDAITLGTFNNSNVAHIIASSPDGPRGDPELSAKLSDSLDNLMLLCLDHHDLIDTHVDDYPIEKLQLMKKKHEDNIRQLCDSMSLSETELVLFMSPIKNKNLVSINPQQAAAAIYPKRKIASQYGLPTVVKSSFDYSSSEYWRDVNNQINIWFQTTLKAIHQMNPTMHFSVFPLAPIPSIVYLGYLFSDKISCDVYQHFRQPDSWAWQSHQLTNGFGMTFETGPYITDKAALIISLTADIGKDRVLNAYDPSVLCTIKAAKHGVDCISSLEDLSAFWHCYQDACDQLKNRYPSITEVGVFISAPVSASFEIGRRFMHETYLPMLIFDENNGFVQTIRIGGPNIDR